MKIFCREKQMRKLDINGGKNITPNENRSINLLGTEALQVGHVG